MTARPLLYLDAARGMRLEQLAGRTRRLVPPAVLAPRKTGRVPPWRPNARGAGVDRAPSSGPAAAPEETGLFAAVGAERRFGSERFWDDPGDGLLFLFHLHGFAPLAAYAAGRRGPVGDRFWARVVESWLRENARPRIPAWHPYPTSVRIVSWVGAISAIEGWPDALRSAVAAELWRQSRYLRRALERDVGGNHVIKNATALVAAGVVFPDSELADAGLRVLRRAVERQLLADGGHEERSTSYHRVVRLDLEQADRLLQAAGRPVPEWLPEAAARCLAWEVELAGPNGELPLLNDAWEMPPVAVGRREPVAELRDSGYVVLRHDDDQAVLDVGPLCPPHLPPHAHADALSFTLWADGAPVVVDPGAFAYDGDKRNRFRGTAAHNTVSVQGRDQCEFWGPFRAAFLPRVDAGPARRVAGATVIEAGHDGYRRLSDAVIHRRTFVWLPGDGLVAVDLLRGQGRHSIASRLQLAPGAPLEGIERVGGIELVPLGSDAAVARVESRYSPYLGQSLPAPALEDRRTVDVEVPFGWALLRRGATVTALQRDRLSLRRRDGSEISIQLAWG